MIDLLLVKLILEALFLPLFLSMIWRSARVHFFQADQKTKLFFLSMLWLLSFFDSILSVFYLKLLPVSYFYPLYRYTLLLYYIAASGLLIAFSLRWKHQFLTVVRYFIVAGLGLELVPLLHLPIQLVHKENYFGYIPLNIFYYLVQTFFIAAMILFAAQTLIRCRRHETPKALLLEGVALISLIISETLFIYACIASQPYAYLAAWFLRLVGASVYFVGMYFSLKKQNTMNILEFFRQKVFYKIVLLIAMVLVITVQGITFINLSRNKSALLNTVVNSLNHLTEKVDSDIVSMDMPSLQRYVEGYSSQDQSYIFLTDKQYRIIAHPDLTKIDSCVEEEHLFQMIFSKMNFKVVQNSIGDSYLQFRQASRNTPYFIYVVKPLSSTYKSIYEAQTQSLYFIGLLIVFILILSVIFAQTIIHPLKTLSDGIRQIEQNNLDYTINIKNTDEFGELAKAFNYMARSLRETQKKLVEAEKKPYLPSWS